MIQCVRDGIGTIHEIHAECQKQGFDTSKASIKNTLLRESEIIEHDRTLGRYVMRAQPRSELVKVLKGSVEMLEGPKVVALGPYQNGGPASISRDGCM